MIVNNMDILCTSILKPTAKFNRLYKIDELNLVKMLIPAGIAVIIVAPEKYAHVSPSISTVNIW